MVKVGVEHYTGSQVFCGTDEPVLMRALGGDMRAPALAGAPRQAKCERETKE